MKVPLIPQHCGPSTRFKRRHRRAIRKALAGMKNTYKGCAYTPAHAEIREAFDLLETAREKCSVKNWGR